MARPKKDQKHIRKLTRLGKKALGITLPIAPLKALGWRERQRLIVKRVPRGFMVIDALSKKRK